MSRARAYIAAGADGIMVSSKEPTPAEILEFCRRYSELDNRVPLVVVPSTYSGVTEEQLMNAGVRVVIYANHLLRGAYPSMMRAARSILESGTGARGRRVLHADQGRPRPHPGRQVTDDRASTFFEAPCASTASISSRACRIRC